MCHLVFYRKKDQEYLVREILTTERISINAESRLEFEGSRAYWSRWPLRSTLALSSRSLTGEKRVLSLSSFNPT